MLGLVVALPFVVSKVSDAYPETVTRPYSANVLAACWLAAIFAVVTRIRGWRLFATVSRDSERRWQISIGDAIWLTILVALGVTPLTYDPAELREIAILWAYIFSPVLAVLHVNVFARLLLANRCKALAATCYIMSFFGLAAAFTYYAVADTRFDAGRPLVNAFYNDAFGVTLVAIPAVAGLICITIVILVLRGCGLRFERSSATEDG